MKKILIAFHIFACLTAIVFAKSEMSSQTAFFRQVTICVFDEFVDSKKELPKTFDSILSLRSSIEKTSISHRANAISYINMLAIVPNAPLIQPEQGISHKFANYRLFAIGRSKSFDKVMSSEGKDSELGGRYSILLNVDNSDAHSMWIPEKEAQIILKQLKGFDPMNRPLAFQDLISEMKRGDGLFRQDQLPTSTDNDSSLDQMQKKRGNSQWPWILGGSILFMALIWIAVHQRR